MQFTYFGSDMQYGLFLSNWTVEFLRHDSSKIIAIESFT